MVIRIVCAGKLKEAAFTQAAKEYEKRLSRFATVELCEVSDEKAPESLSPAGEALVKEKEGERLLGRIKAGDYAIALTLDGTAPNSVAFAEHLQTLIDGGKSPIDFVIGGSLGLGQNVLARANEKLCLSNMTLPHGLCRVFLLEQIYRACKINAHETYHK